MSEANLRWSLVRLLQPKPLLLEDLRLATQPAGQCDACSPMPGEMIEEAIHRLDPAVVYSQPANIYSAELAPGVWVALNLSSNRPAAVLNSPAYGFWQNFRAGQTLASSKLLFDGTPELFVSFCQALLAHALITPINSPSLTVSEESSILTAWLHVSDACNLRCTYCYVSKDGPAMSAKTAEAAIAAIFRSAVAYRFRGVQLKYAGGEAMLNFPVVEQMHQQATALAAQHGFCLFETVLTNGTTLTRERISWLRRSGIRVMVSIDGLGPAHDAQRPLTNGRGSFNLVASAIDRLIDAHLIPDISITITSASVSRLPELLEWLLARALSFSLNFYRESSCSASIPALREDEAYLIEGMQAAYAVIEAYLPERSLLGSLLDRTQLISPHHHACGAGHNYLVFDEQGRVAKCQMDMERTICDVTAADPLGQIRDDTRGIQNLPVSARLGCRDCHWQVWCAGGCSLQTFRVTGRWDVKSPNCNIYQALFPQVLRLEGLRIAKYGRPAVEL